MGNLLEKLPTPARCWIEGLSWQQRRYVLSLCYLMCAAPAEVQAKFLDEYTADGLVAKKLEDQETKQRVQHYLQEFHIETDLSEPVLRHYIRQFYIHSAQDLQRQPDLYLRSALKLVVSSEERNNVLNYILGFELLKMMFCMSWYQHERFYRLQRHQEEFLNSYIKPIQHTHRINGIIVPKDETVFFVRRDYYVQRPQISETKLILLLMATFTAESTSHFGFTLIRHANAICFNYDYIFQEDAEVNAQPPWF